MKKAIGITVHYDDQTTLKVPVEGFQIVVGGGGQSRYDYLNADECPVHGPWKAVPAGISKNSGKHYNAFWTCDTDRDEPRCTNKPAREWVETHPASGTAPDQAPTPEPPAAASSSGEFDDLPF
jgi:hypothetical protein